MTIFHVIKYPLSCPVTEIQISNLPKEVARRVVIFLADISKTCPAYLPAGKVEVIESELYIAIKQFLLEYEE